VHDPEIPGLSIVDLGMVMDIRASPKSLIPPDELASAAGDEETQRGLTDWHIDLAVTYSGCPAIDVIPFLAKAALADQGFPGIEVNMIISPPWSTDWISEVGNEKLQAWGIAPPNAKSSKDNNSGAPKACPQCGSAHTSKISQYGSTPCKALYRCDDCQETFDYFKCY